MIKHIRMCGRLWGFVSARVAVCMCGCVCVKAYGNKENTYTHSSQIQVVLWLSSVREIERVCDLLFVCFYAVGMNANYA